MSVPNPVNALAIRERADARELDALAPEWTALWERCRHATPFQRPEWLIPWLETFTPHEPVILEARRDGRLVLLAPLFLYDDPPDRVLVPAGAGMSDYVELLIEDGEETPALAALAAWLAGTGRDWTRLDLLDLHRASPVLGSWVPAGWPAAVEPHDVCPVLSLPPDPRELARVVPSRQLARLRRARRQAERAGAVRVRVADRDTVDAALDVLVRLHGEAWRARGAPGMLADARVAAFHRRAVPRLLERGVLRLYTLTLDGAPIAALYALFERHGAYCYLQGFDPAYGQLSPAMQLLGAVVEDAARERLPWIDFLRGREAYKYAWGARDEPTLRLCVRRGKAAA